MSKGSVFIVSGPSGSGKDTVLAKVFSKRPNLKFSISSITRPMREGEREGDKYHFISVAEFERMIAEDELLEHNNFVGNFYGTPRKPVEAAINAGDDIIIEIDVNGAAQIREKIPEAISIFILPPSFEVLRSRLTGRGTETKELVEKRLTSAVDEIAEAKKYDYIVINDDLDCAVAEMLAIIDSESFRVNRRVQLVNDILNHK